MTGISMGASMAIAQKFPWNDYQTYVDIGSAQGGLIAQVGNAHSHLNSGGFDLPQTGPIFEEYVASFGLSDRFKFMPGDFFRDPRPKAEVLSMGHILHDRDLDQKKMLLGKAYEALPEGGALIVFEPRNGSWITKVRASSWRTWQNTKMSHHHRGDHDVLYFTMHTNILHVFFCAQLPFLG